MDKQTSTTLNKVVTKMVVLIAAFVLMTTSNAQAAGPSWAFRFNRREFFQLIAPGDRGNASGLDLDFGLPEPEPVYIAPSHNEERVIAPVPAPRRRPQPAPEEEEEEAPPASNPAPAAPPSPPCTPRYAQPSLTFTSVDPPYPIPLGQDPEEEGFNVTITTRGGRKTNSCNRGPNRANLTDISVESVTLSAESVAWIEEKLSQAYPNAHILDAYPLTPTGTENISGSSGTLTFHVDSQDPGIYVITVEARQDRGGTRAHQETFTVKVWLMEGTIWGGGGK